MISITLGRFEFWALIIILFIRLVVWSIYLLNQSSKAFDEETKEIVKQIKNFLKERREDDGD